MSKNNSNLGYEVNIDREDRSVYYISIIISFAIAIWGIVGSKSFERIANSLMEGIKKNFSWAYLLSMLIFVVFSIGIAFSKYGKIKLGEDDSKPEYSTASWFAMLFGAGMGIGLLFWGVAEPLSHFAQPIAGIAPGTEEAANFAMKASFMHWGIHPWANYSILGLALAYFQFRKNKPGLISSIFIPIIGEKRAAGPIGKVIDIFAILATIAGVATSLGMGTMQISSGLNQIFGIPNNLVVWIAIIVVIAVIYIWTAVSGVEKGIKKISDINLYLVFLLLGLAFLVGPTIKIINIFVNSLGEYITTFFKDSLAINPFGDNKWLDSWRVFYWAWWIAWAPFVGTFIARISKGRTIREFIVGVIIAPATASFIWFSVFGGMGLNLTEKLGIDAINNLASKPEIALFTVLNEYPLGFVLSLVAIVLLFTFFITSANSATFVLGMLSSNGNLNPSNKKKIVWGVLQALIAIALLMSGGLSALQTASIAAAFPFIFIMILACISMVKAFREEKL